MGYVLWIQSKKGRLIIEHFFNSMKYGKRGNCESCKSYEY